MAVFFEASEIQIAAKFTLMSRIILLAAVNISNVEHLIGLPQESNAAFFVGLSAGVRARWGSVKA